MRVDRKKKSSFSQESKTDRITTGLSSEMLLDEKTS